MVCEDLDELGLIVTTDNQIPDAIYLQWHGTDDEDVMQNGIVHEDEVTWCRDRINDSDVKYVIAKD